MHYLKSEKILDFVENVHLSRIWAHGDIVSELPVMKGGQPVHPCVLLILVAFIAYVNCFVGA